MKRILYFLVITFAVTFIAWFGEALLLSAGILKQDDLAKFILHLTGSNSPLIGAIISSALCGKKALKSFFKSCIQFKANPLFYLLIFLGLPAMKILVVAVYNRTHQIAPIDCIGLIPTYLMYLPVMFLFGGTEEFGWRGILQRDLQNKFSVFASTLIVILLWSVWHLPLWFIPGSTQTDYNFIYFLLSIAGASFIHAVFFNRTKGSTFFCIFIHLCNSASMGFGLHVLVNPDALNIFPIYSIVIAITGFILFIIFGGFKDRYRFIDNECPESEKAVG